MSRCTHIPSPPFFVIWYTKPYDDIIGILASHIALRCHLGLNVAKRSGTAVTLPALTCRLQKKNLKKKGGITIFLKKKGKRWLLRRNPMFSPFVPLVFFKGAKSWRLAFFFSRFFSFLFRDNMPVTRVRQALHRSNAQAGFIKFPAGSIGLVWLAVCAETLCS